MPDATVGSRLRACREHLALTPEALAEAARLEPALVRAVESGAVTPAIGALARLARALGQRLGTFLDDQPAADPLLVRAADRRADAAPRKGEADPGPIRYFPLGLGKADRHMEPFYVEIRPGAAPAPSSHEGEEFLVCVAGRVRVKYGNTERVLEPGDSLYYNSIVPHEVSAEGPGEARLYAVLFTPF